MRNIKKEIKAKDLNFVSEEAKPPAFSGYTPPTDFSKIKVGVKQLEDAVLLYSDYRKANPRLADKMTVLRAINSYDLRTMREISDFFYKTSGIYARILRYMAFMYRYDWMVTPFVNGDKVKDDAILKGFNEVLNCLDGFNVKKTLGEIALKVLKQGVYYGYKVEQDSSYVLQDLPADYCRSRYNCGRDPAVEFNMRFFDHAFPDTEQRNKILNMFPDEFKKGYSLYKQGKLPAEVTKDGTTSTGWYLLDPKKTVRFTANGEEYPAFISVIPLIIDLEGAQALDRKKTEQRLLKILIQKLPLDKNGDILFDPDEGQALHNNAINMLSHATGIDVLTTYADVEVADMADSSVASAQSDDLERAERQLYNEAGVSQMQFNTDGNIALEKSILNDEATMYNLLLQFEAFLSSLVEKYNKSKIEYKVQLLTTTIYNYKDLAKLYKEQTAMGYSKMLPQIALGQKQSVILANAFFENNVLDLVEVFIPPLQSSIMNKDVMDATGKSGKALDPAGESEVGRPTKESQGEAVTEKTIQNQESMS